MALEPRLELVANLGVNGFTSRDVIEVELPQLDALRPSSSRSSSASTTSSRACPSATYREQRRRASSTTLVERVGADRVLVVTTPDYTVTPSGADYGDPVQQAAGIRENNAIITEVAEPAGSPSSTSTTSRSRRPRTASLVAFDGLHPSGAQYARWVERIAPAMEAILGR